MLALQLCGALCGFLNAQHPPYGFVAFLGSLLVVRRDEACFRTGSVSRNVRLLIFVLILGIHGVQAEQHAQELAALCKGGGPALAATGEAAAAQQALCDGCLPEALAAATAMFATCHAASLQASSPCHSAALRSLCARHTVCNTQGGTGRGRLDTCLSLTWPGHHCLHAATVSTCDPATSLSHHRKFCQEIFRHRHRHSHRPRHKN